MSIASPNTNHKIVYRSNIPWANQNPVIITINAPMIFKMVPLHKVIVPVDIDSFLAPLAGALGVFRW